MKREHRIGAAASLYVVVVGLYAAANGPLAFFLPAAVAALVAHAAAPWVAMGAYLAFVVVALALGVATFRRARRLQPGTPGRARLTILSTVGLAHVLSNVPVILFLAYRILTAEPGLVSWAPGIVDSFRDATTGIAAPWLVLLGVGVVVDVLTWATTLGNAIACWPLVRLPKWVGWVFDGGVLVTFIAVVLVPAVILPLVAGTFANPFAPPPNDPDAVTLPAMRLAITAFVVVRLFFRLTPPFLDLFERLGFQSLVAARHLRTQKSRFLAVIGGLSIMAVAFSSCSLTTTLSVMGGFRNDLKRKILGNHAHIVIDREHAVFEDYESMLDTVRSTDGVRGASPYVTGEVMVTSASNLGGAVLRGIDPASVGQVTELRRNLRHGRLDYLEHPERLLDLPAEESRRTLFPLDMRIRGGSESDADDGTETGDRDELAGNQSPVRDIEALLRGDGTANAAGADGASPGLPSRADPDELGASAPGLLGQQGPDDPPKPEHGQGLRDPIPIRAPREVLPGVIVGQELARSLRLFVGDEVNVVSPLGDLGPAGPMPKSRPFRVAGIFYSGMYEYDMKYIYVTLETAQRFLSTGDAISGIEIKVADVEAAPAVAEDIREGIGARVARDRLRVRDWQDLNKNLFGALALEKLAMFIALGIAILVAGACVFGTLTLMVQEKGRAIAILKAMGTQRGAVVGIFLLEGLLIGLFGASIGLGLGYIVCFGAEHLGIHMNPEVYYIDKLPVHIDLMEFTLVGVASAVVCVVATIFPALAASELRPVDALRYD